MDFTHDEEWRILAETIRRFIADRYTIETRNSFAYDAGWSPELWAEFCGLGIVGALFEERIGGFGGRGSDIALVFEELGRGVVVEPFLGVLMAGRALAVSSGHEDLLQSVIAGDLVAALAYDEASGSYGDMDLDTVAERQGDGWRLNGAKAVVPHAEAAGILLVSARIGPGDAVSLFAVPHDATGVSIRGYPNIDGGRSGDIILTDVDVPGSALVGGEGEGVMIVRDAQAAGLLALCAEAVGIMTVMKDATLEYLRTRVQFDVPIGKFQALQHRMAVMLLEIEQARSAVINAAAAFSAEQRVRDRALSAAKVTIGKTGTLVAEESIQLHGGIGMTWELALSHQAKRLIMIDHQLGDEDHHLRRFIALGEAA